MDQKRSGQMGIAVENFGTVLIGIYMYIYNNYVLLPVKFSLSTIKKGFN